MSSPNAEAFWQAGLILSVGLVMCLVVTAALFICGG